MGKFKEVKKLDQIQKKNRPRGRPKKYITIEIPVNMEYVRKIEELKLEGNMAENWWVFNQNFEVFAKAIELKKKRMRFK